MIFFSIQNIPTSWFLFIEERATLQGELGPGKAKARFFVPLVLRMTLQYLTVVILNLTEAEVFRITSCGYHALPINQ
jgi:hypothetical protein